jgi:TolB-like protein/Tfp pilus assembly protein PilF
MPESDGSANALAHGLPEPKGTPVAIVAGYVFVSYASKDAAATDALVATLERQGLKCWIAPRDVRAGALYADAIIRAISDAKALVLVLSENSIASAHVGKEVERACSKGLPVIALRLDDAPLSPALEYFLSESNWVDARPGRIDAAVAKLIAAIGDPERLASPAGTAAPPLGSAGSVSATHVKTLRRQILTAAALAIVAAMVAASLAEKFRAVKRVPEEKSATVMAPAAAPLTAEISEKSVAVLPFLDMSEQRDQEYFSDGLSEELIDMLTKVPDLRVPARTSSFYFKGKQETVPHIARALGVSHVLEGSVRKSGNHLRITVQLVRADNGYHVWSETYDRQLDDIFKVQDEIATAVVAALKVSLMGRGVPRAPSTSNVEAYTLYLQAQAIHNAGARLVDEERAIDYLLRALRVDRNFARAWASLARYRVEAWGYYTSRSYQDTLLEARDAAEKALELDPTLPDAHIAMADVYDLEWNWKQRDGEIRQALALDPNYALALSDASQSARDQGRFDEALQQAQKAVALDPLQADGYFILATVYFASGRLAESQPAFRQSLDLAPSRSQYHLSYGYMLLAQHDPQAALAQMDQETDERYREVGRALALDALGRTSEADRALVTAETNYGTIVEYLIAAVYAKRNDVGRASDWLDRAFALHDGWLSWVAWDPMLNNLKADARYKALLHKMDMLE